VEVRSATGGALHAMNGRCGSIDRASDRRYDERVARTSVTIVAMLSASLVGAMAACGAFTGTDNTSGDLADGGDGSTGDARALEADGRAPNDGGASKGDAAVPSDAATDVVVAPSEAGCLSTGGYCASLTPAPTFCADFDNPCTLPGKFASVTTSAGTSITVDSVEETSAPNALHVTQSSPSGQTGAWGAVRSFVVPKPGTSASLINVTLDFFVHALPTISTTRLGPIFLDATASGGPTVAFYLENDKSYFVVGDAQFSADSKPGATVNMWHTITMAFKIEPTGGSAITASLDGTLLFNDTSMQIALVPNQMLNVTTGYAPYNLASGETFVDNLVVNITP
jgi:hypothetical protein